MLETPEPTARTEDAIAGGRPLGLVRNGPASARSAEGPPTVVVLGAACSGTTMTVGILQHLGVPFGFEIDSRGEEPRLKWFFEPFWRVLLPWNLVRYPFALRALVQARRAAHGAYGLKLPHMTPFLGLLAPLIPARVYVVVTRNLLTNGLSAKRQRGGWGGARWFETMYLSTLVLASALTTRRPAFVFAYEDATADPRRLVDELAAFLGLEVSEEQAARAAAFVEPGRGYRFVEPLAGFVGLARPDEVRGWAFDVTRPDEPLAVEARVDGRVVAAGRAELPRPDVKRDGWHATGRCGFRLSIDPPLAPDEVDRLSVHVPSLGAVLDRRARPEYALRRGIGAPHGAAGGARGAAPHP